MKLLTVVAVVFPPSTLTVGVYGMIFENMPDFKFENAYHFLLGVMSLIVIALLFRELCWL